MPVDHRKFDIAWLQPLNEPVACRSGSSFKVITLRLALSARLPEKTNDFRFMGFARMHPGRYPWGSEKSFFAKIMRNGL